MDPATSEAAQLWARYLVTWTMWNTVRTFAALVLFVLALRVRA